MEFLQELENMACNAGDTIESCSGNGLSQDYVARWQQIFHYTYAEAVSCIEQQRGDLGRAQISDEHWDMVRLEKECEGYDREMYQHEMQVRDDRRTLTTAF